MINIYVGCAPNHDDIESQAVLEYSIKRNTSEPVNITWMKLSNDPDSPFYGWVTDNWPTPFSAFRWVVAELNGFKGRAIYMDSDIIVTGDIAQLYNMQMTAPVVAKNSSRLCVSLWDCAAVKPHMIPLHQLRTMPNNHGAARQQFGRHVKVQPFSRLENWNCLDGEDYKTLSDPRIRAIHYTAMRHQPQHKHASVRLAAQNRKHWFDGDWKPHPRQDLQQLFDNLLEQAGSLEKYTNDPLFGDYKKIKVGNIGKPSWIKHPST